MIIRLHLGQIVATPPALDLLTRLDLNPAVLLARHASGDWGDLDSEDKASNDWAVSHQGRLLSSYNVAPDKKIWIITEADRSATTILLPSDY